MRQRSVVVALFALLVAACSNLGPADPVPPRPASEFRNLQVLPDDIPREELIEVMRSFARGLGVRCNHCHVVTATEPEEELDFASDAKETKRAARVMLMMVQEINGPWMERVEIAEGEHEEEEEGHEEEEGGLRVTCWTCHRGQPEPASPPPPTQPAA